MRYMLTILIHIAVLNKTLYNTIRKNPIAPKSLRISAQQSVKTKVLDNLKSVYKRGQKGGSSDDVGMLLYFLQT